VENGLKANPNKFRATRDEEVSAKRRKKEKKRVRFVERKWIHVA
jgi:hypothetical protein